MLFTACIFCLFLPSSPPGEPVGMRLTLQTDPPALDETVETLRKRLGQLDIDAGFVAPAPGGRIIVEVPRTDDPDRVRQFLQRRANLELRFVRALGAREAILEHFGGQLPADVDLLSGETGMYAVEKRSIVTGRDIQHARPQQGQFGTPIVFFSLRPESAKAFGDATEANINAALAIVLDGHVVSAPIVRARIESDGIIEGDFTEKEAEDLAILLRAGALPAPVRIVEERILEPAPPRPRHLLPLLGIAAFFVLFCAFLVALYRRGGRPRPG